MAAARPQPVNRTERRGRFEVSGEQALSLAEWEAMPKAPAGYVDGMRSSFARSSHESQQPATRQSSAGARSRVTSLASRSRSNTPVTGPAGSVDGTLSFGEQNRNLLRSEHVAHASSPLHPSSSSASFHGASSPGQANSAGSAPQAVPAEMLKQFQGAMAMLNQLNTTFMGLSKGLGLQQPDGSGGGTSGAAPSAAATSSSSQAATGAGVPTLISSATTTTLPPLHPAATTAVDSSATNAGGEDRHVSASSATSRGAAVADPHSSTDDGQHHPQQQHVQQQQQQLLQPQHSPHDGGGGGSVSAGHATTRPSTAEGVPGAGLLSAASQQSLSSSPSIGTANQEPASVDRLKQELESLTQAKRKALIENKKLVDQLDESNKQITVLKQKLQKAGIRDSEPPKKQ